MNGDCNEFCAPGARCSEQYLSVGPQISLRVVSFQPPQRGTFPTIFFVPGWISLMSAWKEVLKDLTSDFSVEYIETREKRSSRVHTSARYGVGDIAGDIARAVSVLSGENGFVLLGSSLGATALVESCRLFRKRPQSLVLIEPNAAFRIPPLGLFIVKMSSPSLYCIIKPVIKWYLRTFRLDPKTDYAQYAKYCSSLDAADPWKLKKAAIAFSHYQVWRALQSISMPVLVFGASRDVLHEPEHLKRMVSSLEQVTEIDLETNKRTHSAEMVSYLRRFLAGS
jgi:pimeloyl-ACP methyl ester carboxylesterase